MFRAPAPARGRGRLGTSAASRARRARPPRAGRRAPPSSDHAEVERRLQRQVDGRSPRRRRDDPRHEQREQGARDDAREHARDAYDEGADAHDAAQERRRRALGLEVVEVAAVVAQVGEHRQGEAESREEERDGGGGVERDQRAVAERVVVGLVEQRLARDRLDAAERRPGERGHRRAVPPEGSSSQISFVRPAPGDRESIAVRRLSTSPITASPVVPGKWSTIAATRTGTRLPPIWSGSVPPTPPASTPSRGVTSTAGGRRVGRLPHADAGVVLLRDAEARDRPRPAGGVPRLRPRRPTPRRRAR